MKFSGMLLTVGWRSPFTKPCFLYSIDCGLDADYCLRDKDVAPLYACHMHLREAMEVFVQQCDAQHGLHCASLA